MMIATIRVRSSPRMSAADERALKSLHLNTPHSCAVVEDKPDVRRQIIRVAGFCTWGAISDASLALMRKKAKDPQAVHFRLSPPRHGYGRKGVKMQFKNGGALGDRGDKMDDLIKRMA